MNTTTTDFDDNPLALATEAPLQPAAAGKFTQEQALDWLTANANSAKPVREIAQIWGWHRSRVQRFLSHFRETSGQTAALSRETSSETSETSSETPPLSQPEISETNVDFDWSDEEVVVVPPQPALAAYFNRNGHIVIRADRSFPHCGNSDDIWIVIAPENVPKLIAKLNALLEELQEH